MNGGTESSLSRRMWLAITILLGYTHLTLTSFIPELALYWFFETFALELCATILYSSPEKKKVLRTFPLLYNQTCKAVCISNRGASD